MSVIGCYRRTLWKRDAVGSVDNMGGRCRPDKMNLLTLDVPIKGERVEWVDLGSEERPLYEFFKRFSYLSVDTDKTTKREAATNILVLIFMLWLIYDHREALLPESVLTA